MRQRLTAQKVTSTTRRTPTSQRTASVIVVHATENETGNYTEGGEDNRHWQGEGEDHRGTGHRPGPTTRARAGQGAGHYPRAQEGAGEGLMAAQKVKRSQRGGRLTRSDPLTRVPVPIRVTPDLIDRIDEIRPDMIPREPFVRHLLEMALAIVEEEG